MELSSAGWHEGRHDPWPYINYLLFTIKTAYREFKERAENLREPRGAKTEQVMEFIRRQTKPFTVAMIRAACPAVGIDTIRKVLKRQKAAGSVEPVGFGRDAAWRRVPEK